MQTGAAKRERAVVSATTPSPTTRPLDAPAPGIPDAAAIYAQAAHENFPVASRFLPRPIRDDLMSIYGFARLTDDIGDEVTGDRLDALAWLEAELGRAAAGSATHPVMRRLGTTIAARRLSLRHFRDLIEANRRDQTVRRYQTFDALLEYCSFSANPVGRLVLEVLGAATAERIALSDDVCSGLQIVEHLQDVGEDFSQDRVYLPLTDLREEGCAVPELGQSNASAALRRVVATEGARARRMLWSGAPLAASLEWRPRVAVAAFAAGGMAALDDIERAGNDVLGMRCRPRARRVAARLLLVLLWHPAPGRSAAPTATTSAVSVSSTTSAARDASPRRDAAFDGALR